MLYDFLICTYLLRLGPVFMPDLFKWGNSRKSAEKVEFARKKRAEILAKVQEKGSLREKGRGNSRKSAGKREFARKRGKEFSQKCRRSGVCEKKKSEILAKVQEKGSLREKEGRDSRKNAEKVEFARKRGERFSQKGRRSGVCENTAE